jgi:protein-tyrosine phosphatase
MAAPPTVDVAFICTGNRFRSPLAAALLSAEVDGLPVRASSLGVLDLGTVEALEEAVTVGRSFGVDLSGHQTRCLRLVDLEPLDLVVGFEWAHVQAAIVDGRARIERTFTLPELVGLLRDLPESEPESTPAEQVRARVQQAHDLRPAGFMSRRPPEIPDPLGRPSTAQKRIADEVRELVAELAERLFR